MFGSQILCLYRNQWLLKQVFCLEPCVCYCRDISLNQWISHHNGRSNTRLEEKLLRVGVVEQAGHNFHLYLITLVLAKLGYFYKQINK